VPTPGAAGSGGQPAPVTPTELTRRDSDGDELAYVRLNLVLYLGAYPSREELVGAFRAFRRHFPVEGELAWGLPARFYLALNSARDPDSEEWADAVRADGSGMYGIRLAIGDHVLNLCGVPATEDGAPRASFCEVMLPVDADPRRLMALAVDLAELLPVRSGHGGGAGDPGGAPRGGAVGGGVARGRGVSRAW